MSSSSAAVRPATRRPCAAGWRASTSPWSKRRRSAAPACTAAASRPRSSWRRRRVYRTVTGAKEFGIAVDPPSIEFAQSQARKQKVVDQLWRGLQGLMKRRKITTFIGTGTLGPDHVVRVDDETELVGQHVILASGSVPRSIPGFEVDGDLILTSDEVLDLEQLPASAVVIGGGAIGCEFASMLADLGTQVTVLEALPKILPGLRQGRGRRGAAVVQEAGHRGPHRCHGDRPHAQRRRPVDDRPLRRRRRGHRGRGGGLGRPPAAVGQSGPGRHQGPGRPPRLRRGRRVHADRRAGRVRGRRSGRHPGPGPRRLRRGGGDHRPDPGRRRSSRSTTRRCPGASTAIPRWPSPGCPRRRPWRPGSTW